MKRLLCALVLSLSLASCAPSEQAYLPATENPAVQGAYFIAHDGAKLPLRSWLPRAKPKAVILALHGFNDYSNAFTGAGEYFRTRGIATFAYDQRGFGASPNPGIWAGEENLTRDAATLLSVLRQQYPRTPLYLMGESMGGAVAIRTLATRDAPVDGLILSAPAVWGGEHMPLLYKPVLWLSAYTLPGYKLTGQDLRIRASDNIKMLIAMGKDPLVIKATRIDAIYGLSNLMDDAYGSANTLHTPALLLYGLKDQVIPKPPVDAWQTAYGGTIRVTQYENGYHMLTRDLAGKKVLSDIADWVLARRR